ncbi:MAG: signal peptidase [Clostridiales bacterium]|jgi:signal peptidase I|nr:signal peptidase [Clostridiales bacterium]
MRNSKFLKEALEWAKSIVIAIIIAVIILYFIWPTRVKQHSMEDTLKSGQFIFASRFLYDIGEPELYDIAIMKVDYEGTGEKRLVKRIIGLEGDHIVIKEGVVTVNGIVLEENYILGDTTIGSVDLIVERGKAFVMGDNRQTSIDSRSFGTVFLEKIYAKVLFQK